MEANITSVIWYTDISSQIHNLSRSGRQLDLDSAASGYGNDYYCPEGIPVETALFMLLGALGLAFGILFRAITFITGAARRKRRKRDMSSKGELLDADNDDHDVSLYNKMADNVWYGMYFVWKKQYMHGMI